MVAMNMARGFSQNLNEQRAQAAAMNDAFQHLQQRKLGPSISGIRHSTAPVFTPPDGDIGYAPYPVPIGMDTGMVRVATAIGAGMAHQGKEAGIMGSMAGLAAGSKPLAKGLFQVGQGLKAPVRAASSMLATPGAQKVVGGVQRAGQAVSQGVQQAASSPMAQKAIGGAKSLGRTALTAGALGAGALGLGAYAVAKPTLGYLSKEQQPANWGGTDFGAPQLPYGVNQYGQPQLGTPFIR
jgi:hypothetical protein